MCLPSGGNRAVAPWEWGGMGGKKGWDARQKGRMRTAKTAGATCRLQQTCDKNGANAQ